MSKEAGAGGDTQIGPSSTIPLRRQGQVFPPPLFFFLLPFNAFCALSLCMCIRAEGRKWGGGVPLCASVWIYARALLCDEAVVWLFFFLWGNRNITPRTDLVKCAHTYAHAHDGYEHFFPSPLSPSLSLISFLSRFLASSHAFACARARSLSLTRSLAVCLSPTRLSLACAVHSRRC
jgi:hypothetical protein